jgi:2-polyprenyl-3-methyl-5-hydroxy-6-metoxy-1,4-benzoquinol methylase
MLQSYHHHPSSYRDPSGFIFEKEGVLYRQVNKIFKEDFDHFINSGCYEAFVKKGFLIPHETTGENLTGTEEYYKTLKPETVPFISYAYEWSFDMLKDAALLTLQLLKEAVDFGLILKDATPYNIQWHRGKLIFIDSLSFEKYNEQEPWIAYRQFCESFLSPLLLMHYSKQPLQQLQLAYPEGIPLAVTKSLLPRRSRFSLHTYLHIHLHARVSSKSNTNSSQQNKFSKQKLLNLVSSLETLINKLKLPAQKTTWSEYYDEASQRNDYLEQKKQLIQQWTGSLTTIKTAADLGANDGVFSKLLAEQNIFTVATDFDPLCINNLYAEIKKNNQQYLQPLVIDLSNPSPAIGVNNTERLSFISRTKVDLAMALAVIHHLAIGKNIPLEKIASLFNQVGGYLIIEFVPKDDEKIQFMLKSKEDIYTHYTEENFESAFIKHFTIQNKQKVGSSGRTLYLMKRNA